MPSWTRTRGRLPCRGPARGRRQPDLGALVTLGKSDQIQGPVTVDETGELRHDGFSDTIGSLVLRGGKVATGLGTLTLGGNILVQQSAQTAVIEGKLSLGNDSRTFNVPARPSPGLACQGGAQLADPGRPDEGRRRHPAVRRPRTATPATRRSLWDHRARTPVGAGSWRGDEHQDRRPSAHCRRWLD